MNDGDHANEPLPAAVIRWRMALVVLAHAALFALALFAAFLMSYNFRLDLGSDRTDRHWFATLYLPLLAVALPIKLFVFFGTRQYHGSWRYVGLRDLFGVTSASLISTFLFLTVFFVLENLWQATHGTPLIDRASFPVPDLRQSAVFFLDWACTIAFVSAARILVRFYYEEVLPRAAGTQKRVLIVGAGDTGETVVRELLRMSSDRYICVGFLDDRGGQTGALIHGVEVLGGTDIIREVCERERVQEVWIALPKPTPAFMRALVERAGGGGVQFRTIPAVADVVEGRVHVRQVRDVDITDLLGREPVQLDAERIGEQLRGKRVLVTGAGGSIGSELCRQVAAFQPRRLALVEQAENNLFEIDRELRRRFPEIEITCYIGDIVDRKRVGNIFEREQPSVVFHAAAHKHVPMMEINPGEAVKNNIGGTAVVAETALAAGVDTMVMISTDKAVNPTSIMGCTKRAAELYVQSLSGPTQFITVRFGNVLGSSGSVVPIFREQIAAGGPVTVTHPDMVRYFMTIPEAAQLVLQAGVIGKGGEIFVLDMGEPVRILDLARDMITLSGLRPNVDIEIEFSGVRPGEKLFEELSMESEDIGDTAHPKIGIWKHRVEDHEVIRAGVANLLAMADTADDDDIVAELQALVPEYRPEKNRVADGPQISAGTTVGA